MELNISMNALVKATKRLPNAKGWYIEFGDRVLSVRVETMLEAIQFNRGELLHKPTPSILMHFKAEESVRSTVSSWYQWILVGYTEITAEE